MRALLAAILLLIGAASGALAQSGAPLPSGYLSVSGNQIQDGSGTNVRLACVGYPQAPAPPISTFSGNLGNMRNQLATGRGFNCIRIDYYDAFTCPGGTCNFSTLDAIVTAAAANGMRVIIDHHGNEGVPGSLSCDSQQKNGIWYDIPTSAPYNTPDGTDGCGTTGTVTYAQFKANWVAIASHYAGNSTVIGFDLDNEPLTYGLNVSIQGNWAGFGSNGATPGAGNGSDIVAMANDVGAAIEAADPGVLIILEGLINGGALVSGAAQPNTSGGIQDLSRAHSNPVTGVSASKVVYSVHDYPTAISGVTPDSGSGSVTARNLAWGYLEINNYAPVWVGEMGGSLDGLAESGGANLAEEQAWAAAITSYLNGTASGGPTFSGTQQPMGSDWWLYGYLGGQYPDGTLNADGTNKSGQQTYWSTLLYTASGGGGGGGTATWNPSDTGGTVTLSGSNLIATFGSAGGAGVRSTTSQSAGKWCAKVTLTTLTGSTAVGVSTATENLLGYLGGAGSAGVGLFPSFGAGQEIYENGSTVSTGTAGPGASGDTVTIELDATANLVWVTDPAMIAAGYTYNNSPTANPETGVGGISTASFGGPYFIEANTQDIGTVETANFSPTGCTASFAPWGGTTTTYRSPIFIFGTNDNDPIMRAFHQMRKVS